MLRPSCLALTNLVQLLPYSPTRPTASPATLERLVESPTNANGNCTCYRHRSCSFNVRASLVAPEAYAALLSLGLTSSYYRVTAMVGARWGKHEIPVNQRPAAYLGVSDSTEKTPQLINQRRVVRAVTLEVLEAPPEEDGRPGAGGQRAGRSYYCESESGRGVWRATMHMP